MADASTKSALRQALERAAAETEKKNAPIEAKVAPPLPGAPSAPVSPEEQMHEIFGDYLALLTPEELQTALNMSAVGKFAQADIFNSATEPWGRLYKQLDRDGPGALWRSGKSGRELLGYETPPLLQHPAYLRKTREQLEQEAAQEDLEGIRQMMKSKPAR